MKGILLLSHGTLCQGILSAMEVIGCDTDKVEAISLFMDTELDEYTKQLEDAIDRLDTGEGVLVIVDLLAGTPFNRSCMMLENKNIEVITGMNLPMCITALDCRETGTLRDMVETCISEGRDGVMDVRAFLE